MSEVPHAVVRRAWPIYPAIAGIHVAAWWQVREGASERTVVVFGVSLLCALITPPLAVLVARRRNRAAQPGHPLAVSGFVLLTVVYMVLGLLAALLAVTLIGLSGAGSRGPAIAGALLEMVLAAAKAGVRYGWLVGGLAAWGAFAARGRLDIAFLCLHLPLAFDLLLILARVVIFFVPV